MFIAQRRGFRKDVVIVAVQMYAPHCLLLPSKHIAIVYFEYLFQAYPHSFIKIKLKLPELISYTARDIVSSLLLSAIHRIIQIAQNYTTT